MDLIFYRLHTPRGSLTLRQTAPQDSLGEVMLDAPPGLIEAYINDENSLLKAEWNEIIPKVAVSHYLAWQIVTKGIESVLFS